MMGILSEAFARMHPSWQKVLESEFQKPYMLGVEIFLQEEKKLGSVVYPPAKDIFAAFAETPFDQVSVVIIGQDPYHGPGQAHGLSFSVPAGVAVPPSLQNIFKELKADLGIMPSQHGCLLKWARQGVLLLNATLTVRGGLAASHQGRGWELFTDRVVQLLCERAKPLVFLLWGKFALAKFEHVPACKEKRHLALIAAHPSPFSAHRYFGCRHFSQANAFLEKMGEKPIDWAI